jgi:hypothetical protein
MARRRRPSPLDRQPIPPEVEGVPPESRERIRLAIIEVRDSGDTPTLRRVRAVAEVDQGAVAIVVRAHVAGDMPPLMQPWDVGPGAADGGGSAGLVDMIRAAETDSDRERLAMEIAAMVATGDLRSDDGRVLAQLLTNARQSAVKRRELEPPPEDPTKLLLASAEAMSAARAFDLIVDDDRRDRVLAYVAAELAADRAAIPNVDEGGA